MHMFIIVIGKIVRCVTFDFMLCFLSLIGEEALSYGYGGTGKASTECNFVDYGQEFGPGDVITAYLVSRLLYNF